MRITVLGVGDVVCNRYFTAAAALHDQYGFAISDVIDLRPATEIHESLKSVFHGDDVQVHHLDTASADDVCKLIHTKGLLERPIIIATPSNTHVPYATRMLEQGMRVCVEKPLAASEAHLLQMQSSVAELGTENFFLLGYFALEKGLGLLALARSGNVPSAYLQMLEPTADRRWFDETRKELGAVRNIRAALLEGQGPAGQLEHRSWILDPEVGGNTVDTFYHLVCMTLPFLGDANQIQIQNAGLAKHAPTANWYQMKTGRIMAETLTTAVLKNKSGVESRLVCAKYVPNDLHERWMEVEFDHGYAYADFEECSLRIELPKSSWRFDLKHQTNYATQFAIFAEKLRNPKTPVEFELFCDSLKLTLAIRSAGLSRSVRQYQSSDLNRDWLNSMLE